jgi:hypothetical protein
MTYRAFKYVTEGLLTGDNKLPKEDDVLKALLGMAYNTVANKCQVLNLMTLDKSADVLRLGKGQYLVQRPELPESDTDELAVDDDLCYAVASLVASYISKDKTTIHENRATQGIRDYNAKVNEILESLELQEDGRYDL